MRRSYKHTPVYKGDKDRFAKKLAICIKLIKEMSIPFL